MLLNRLSLFISLLGMALALHLWIQKERNFDQGCWGTAHPTATVVTGGCNDQELQKHSEFLHISVAAWGYAFYFSVACLTLGKLLLPEQSARVCQTASEVVVALAFPFSVYLLGIQAFVAKAFCPLCLISGALVTAHFIIHVIQYKRGFVPVPEQKRFQEAGYATILVFVFSGLLFALFIIVNQIGTRRLDQGDQAKQFEIMLGRSLPKFIDAARLQEMKPALYNPELSPLDLNAWLADNPPALGSQSGLPVFVFLDPNCPSCKATYATIHSLAGRYNDRVRFHIVSRILWDYSLLQTQALELAAREGKYQEMWQLQFEHAKKGGLKLGELETLFAKLGLDTGNLAKRLEEVRTAVVTKRDRAIAAGIRGTPTVFINGRAVAQNSTDQASLAKMLDEALAGRTTAAK